MISIIIPLYKVEQYIEDCLRSIEQQTFKDFEVVVVNDGSPDSSAEIVKNFISKSKMTIRLINQENSGVSAARNNGIANASGDYICFVDSDDMLNRDYLRLMFDNIKSYNSDICICSTKHIHENESLLENYDKLYQVRNTDKNSMLYDMLYGKVKAGIWDLLIRREILGDLKFAENYKYSEDLEMVWKLVASSNSITYLSAPLYIYRERLGSATSKINNNRIQGMTLFKKLELFFEDKAPSFAVDFKKYGVAKWVWATLWQEALAAKNYSSFADRIIQYDPYFYMQKLNNFQIAKWRISSKLFCFSKYLYYILVKLYKIRLRKYE